MTDSTTVNTGAGYQPDGGTAQAENNPPAETPKDTPQQTPDTKEQTTEEPKSEGNPLTALVQSRQMQREASNEIDLLKQEIASLKAAQTPAQARQEQPTEWKNPYDPVEAPVDHIKAELTHTQSQVKALREEGTERLKANEGVTALRDFEEGIAREISMASEQTPELLPAYGFINNHFTNLYRGQGLAGDRLAQAVRNGVLQAYVNGRTNGMSAVQTTAQIAINLGFNPKGNQAKVDPVKRGQKAAGQSLGQATATGGDTAAPSAAQLTKMSKEELTGNNRANLNRLKQMAKGEIPIE